MNYIQNQHTHFLITDAQQPYQTNSDNELEGGTKQEWKKLLEQLKQIPVQKLLSHLHGEDQVNNHHGMNKNTVFHPKFNPNYQKQYGLLDPKTLTFEDIRQHAIVHQGKDEHGTVKKLMDYLSKMTQHPIYPLDFNNPDWEQYFHYMDQIKINGELDRYGNIKPVGIHGLLNRDEAWLMYLKSIGYEDFFPRYRTRLDKNKVHQASQNTLDKAIPTPEIVHNILRYEYIKKEEFNKYYKQVKDKGIRRRDLNKYIQYQFFFGFFIGMAFEKEMVILNLQDVIDQADRYAIRITRPKIGNKKRMLKLEGTISKSPVHKSVHNYLTKIRPKFADKKETAFSVNPKTGRRWGYDLVEQHERNDFSKVVQKGCDQLRGYMERWGKRVYPQFYPYLMRHWCGTARMIDWDKEGDAFARVQVWLGHADPKDTTIYVQLHRLWDDNKGSWLSRALKRDWYGGMDGSKNSNAQHINNKSPVVQILREQPSEFPQARGFLKHKLRLISYRGGC